LADLGRLFDFVEPGLLGALNDFSQRYRKPVEANRSQNSINLSAWKRPSNIMKFICRTSWEAFSWQAKPRAARKVSGHAAPR